MKNAINYYYNLYINSFKKNNDSVTFVINNNIYEFLPFQGNFQEIYKVYLILRTHNKYCHEIVVNKDNSFITLYNGKEYILLKKDLSPEKYVDMGEILNYDIEIFDRHELNWKELWQEKVDYYEYQMSQLSIKYSLLKESFNYYVGMTETAISLLEYIDSNKIKYSISHKKIYYKEKMDIFFNPMQITIDSRVRDIAEYIKINFMNNVFNLDDTLKLIDYLHLNDTEAILFLSRLLYPSYYFYEYEKIIFQKSNEQKLLNYIEKNTQYEVFLSKIYKYLKSKFYIPEVEWLN